MILPNSIFFQGINITLIKLTKSIIDVSKSENMVLKKQFDEAVARTELNSNQFEELICNTSSKENRKIDVSL